MSNKENINVQQPKKNSKFKANLRQFWIWFKDTAWIQVLLIILVIFGIFISIPYIVKAVEKAIESSRVSTFYEDNQISYDDLQTKIGEEDQFTVFFYGEDCPHCETVQKDIEKYYTDLGKEHIVYTINVNDKDYITTAELNILHDEYARVYGNQDDKYISSDYKEFNSASQTSVPTPTLVLYKDGAPVRIMLGVDESNPQKFMHETFYGEL